jgi:HD-GYP domain-containing protein (c-di-GMP phosphodiesterase class II)
MDERQETLPVGSQRTAKLVPIRGRVLALARELERLTREGGPGGGALGLEEALHVLRDRAGHELDADLVRACHLAHRAGALAAGAPPGLLCLPLG